MRKYLNINLKTRAIETKELTAKKRQSRTLLDCQNFGGDECSKVDPLSPQNPLIFSAGPLRGQLFSAIAPAWDAESADGRHQGSKRWRHL